MPKISEYFSKIFQLKILTVLQKLACRRVIRAQEGNNTPTAGACADCCVASR